MTWGEAMRRAAIGAAGMTWGEAMRRAAIGAAGDGRRRRVYGYRDPLGKWSYSIGLGWSRR